MYACVYMCNVYVCVWSPVYLCLCVYVCVCVCVCLSDMFYRRIYPSISADAKLDFVLLANL